MKSREWARLLAYVSGLVNQELLLHIEYLAPRTGSCGHIRHASSTASFQCGAVDARRDCKRLGRKGLEKMALVATPDTILAWFRKLVAQKFDGSKHRSYRVGQGPVRKWKS